jgi:hypothetical protein
VSRLVIRHRGPFPGLNTPPPGERRTAEAAGEETRESHRALLLEFQGRTLTPARLSLYDPTIGAGHSRSIAI